MPNRQPHRVKKVLEGQLVKGKTRKQAMLEAGYSESYANASQITKTKTWEEILADKFSNEEVSTVHKSLLMSRNPVFWKFPLDTNEEDIREIFTSCGGLCLSIVDDQLVTLNGMKQWKSATGLFPDRKSIKYALDLVYKLKGQYKDTALDDRSKYDRMPLDQLLEEKQRAIAENKLLAERYEQFRKGKGSNPKTNGKPNTVGGHK